MEDCRKSAVSGILVKEPRPAHRFVDRFLETKRKKKTQGEECQEDGWKTAVLFTRQPRRAAPIKWDQSMLPS